MAQTFQPKHLLEQLTEYVAINTDVMNGEHRAVRTNKISGVLQLNVDTNEVEISEINTNVITQKNAIIDVPEEKAKLILLQFLIKAIKRLENMFIEDEGFFTLPKLTLYVFQFQHENGKIDMIYTIAFEMEK
jgi:hypothetical protein